MGHGPQSAAEVSKLATSAGFRMLAGLLFMIPGFLTDILAGLLLIPALQHYLRGKMTGGFTGVRTEWPARQGPVIEGEAVEIEGEIGEDRNRRPQPPGFRIPVNTAGLRE
jgi:UPF0716 family protein affecting phage T7 exclusion